MRSSRLPCVLGLLASLSFLATLSAACSAGGSSSGAAAPESETSLGEDGGNGSADARSEGTDGAKADGATVDSGPEAAPSYEKVVVDFDDLDNGATVTDQYADHVRFSSESGIPIKAEHLINIGQSQPNYMSAGGGSNVLHPLYVDFERPVRNLRFRALSVTYTGTIASIRVLHEQELLATVSIVGTSSTHEPVPVDLSAYSDVTRIEIVDITDLYGIVYDDFSFEIEE